MQKLSSPAKSGLFYFLAMALCGLGFSGCDWGGSRIANKPVLQVNEARLSTKDFADQLARRLKGYDALAAKDPGNVKRAKEDIIRNFILRSLITNYAALEKIEVSNDDLDKEINSFRASYPDDLSFRRALAEESLSMTEWKEDLRHSLLEKKVFNKITEKVPKPSDEDFAKYFEENKNLYKRGERILLRQIISDDLSKAQSIRDELKKKDFAEMAKKFSVAPEAKNGGLVGWIEKGSVDIFDKAFSLPIGSISPVLESVYGFHIFKVERKLPPGYAAKDEVKNEIIQTLRAKKEQAEFASWLDKQIRISRVLKDSVLIEAIQVETRGR